ncbi:hypothetical protein CONPUDRAFT_139307 [Coniophora puteana RWD-64-598 SS2]|uniref:F-box domain-containing protein n=1 Tax=Coniophora puteana (strain RWD-64-598) TaxID=741705 RepID=A0A5M3MEE2_CONPW|nr:uncharacterized protein CONPUDRAFT_139307 [Coniophora puteana RWD-64-598 SS2]EIW77417.1 hypothetical protein CONPUDRAFT_139307 [Coniophora puteana RWD-64-598 SS2]
MVPCLEALCRELLDKICEEVWYIDSKDKSHRSLIALAQTCKALHDPALDVYYAEVTGVKALFMMLPRECWMIEGEVLNLTRMLQLIDWESFERNSHRVRSFIQPNEPLEVHDEALKAACYCPHGPLLPNLQRLLWTNIDIFPGDFVRLLLGHNLIEVHLFGISKAFYPIISVMGVTCSSLEGFLVNLERDEDAEALRGVVEEVLPRIPRLESLYLGFPSSPSLLQKAEGLPHLRELTIESLVDSDLITTNQNHNFSFPGLRRLRICHSPLNDTAKTLDRIGPWPTVSEFACYVSTSDSAAELKQIIQSVSSNFSPNHLSSMVLKAQRSSTTPLDDPTQLPPVSMQSLQPLFSYVSLQELVIRTGVPLSLSDGDIKSIASSFPKLCVFNLGGGSIMHAHKWPTLLGLAYLVDSCPLLEEIHLSVNALRRPDLPPPKADYGRNRKITTLHLGCSPIKDSVYVSSFVSLLLPKLRSVNTVDFSDGLVEQVAERFSEEWKMVNKFLTVFQGREKYSERWSSNARNASYK